MEFTLVCSCGRRFPPDHHVEDRFKCPVCGSLVKPPACFGSLLRPLQRTSSESHFDKHRPLPVEASDMLDDSPTDVPNDDSASPVIVLHDAKAVSAKPEQPVGPVAKWRRRCLVGTLIVLAICFGAKVIFKSDTKPRLTPDPRFAKPTMAPWSGQGKTVEGEQTPDERQETIGDAQTSPSPESPFLPSDWDAFAELERIRREMDEESATPPEETDRSRQE